MGFEPKFIPVLHAMVEPELKLVVAMSSGPIQGDEESVRLSYDPEIGPDQLTMPPPQFLKEILERRHPEQPSKILAPVLFKSERAESVIRIFLRKIYTADTLMLIGDADQDRIDKDIYWIKKASIPGATGYASELLYAAFKVIIQLPYWDWNSVKSYLELDKKTGKWVDITVSRVGFYLKKSAAVRLAQMSSFRFDTVTDGMVLVAEREIRS